MIPKYWAIKLGPYVEIRRALNPPKLETTRVRKLLKYKRGRKNINKVVTITVSYHNGGKHLGVVKDVVFYKAHRGYVEGMSANEVRQIEPKIKRRLLGN
jgi:hypothetical protein